MIVAKKAALGAVALFAIANPALAVDYFWSNPATGNWNNTANWSTGVIPTGGDNGFINNGGTALIDASQNVVTSLATMGRGAGESGTLIMTGGTLTTNSDIRAGGNTAAGGGTGSFDLSGGTVFMNGGNLNIGQGSGGAVGTVRISGGSLQINAGFVAAIGNRGTGTLNQTGGTLFIRSGTTPGNGMIQLGRNNATTTGSGTYTLSGGTAAALATRFGEAIASAAGSVNTFNLQGTGRLITNTIEVRNTNAVNTFNFSGGTLNVANINIPLTNNGGRLNPGGANFTATPLPADINGLVVAAIGTLTFGGNNSYIQGPAGILDIDIDASGNDLVNIGGAGDGTATIAGTIAVNLLGGLDPALGQTFDVLTADTVTNSAIATGLTPSGNIFIPTVVAGSDGRQVLRLTVAEVPEPGALAVLGGAALALANSRSRKRKTAL